MRPGIATHVFLQQRLTPALLDTLVRGGASAIEVFAARHHFDYTDRASIQELANWFRSNNVAAALHMPLFADERHWTRHTAPTLNLISTNKSTRIQTMDEVKRSLESAEQVPFATCTLHLGLKDDQWDTRALDDSFTAIEHLKAFAGPLGVKLLLENLTNDVATPQHLIEIVNTGHFSTVGFAFDLGHAHLGQSIPETRDKPARSALELAFEAFAPVIAKIATVDIHDNGGVRDEHFWPHLQAVSGSIDWALAKRCLATLPSSTIANLELTHEFGEDAADVAKQAAAAFQQLGL
jgi:sugar phosphate isomerase/epimerase